MNVIPRLGPAAPTVGLCPRCPFAPAGSEGREAPWGLWHAQLHLLPAERVPGLLLSFEKCLDIYQIPVLCQAEGVHGQAALYFILMTSGKVAITVPILRMETGSEV